MNSVGDVARGDTIGKRIKEWFVWTECPSCTLKRWVRRSKKELSTYTGWCQTCSALRNNKTRTYSKAEMSLAWKGGRTTDHGYILIRLQPSDFFYPMAKHDGYVREHRLVVAKALNRCLLPWEVVHHQGVKYPLGSIENKQDNRYPENLVLLSSSGKHNKEIERLIKQARSEGYKAGQEEERKGGHNSTAYLEGLKDGKQEGIREVVDKLKDHPDFYKKMLGNSSDWQVKLKEWGI